MQQLAVSIAGLPLQLVLISDGTVAFVLTAYGRCVIDQPEDASQVSAMFDESGFSIGVESQLAYNVAYRYKEIPCMLAWLKQERLSL